MPSFKDKAGRDWEINIDAPSALKIRAECDPKFVLGDDDPDSKDTTWTRLEADTVLLCRVIFLLCYREREARDISEADFYALLGGEGTIDAATEAVLDAIVNFTPRRQRKLLRAVREKEERVKDRAMELALAKVNHPAMEDKMHHILEEKIDELWTDLMGPESVIDSPASSASAPEV